MELWQGRDDRGSEGEAGRRWHQAMQSHRGGENMVLLGFACDAGVARNQGRIGAAAAPDVLRQALANLPLRGEIPADAGNVLCQNDELETAQADLIARAEALLRQKSKVLILGGGHEVAYASGMALLQALPDARIGIINIDAHLDLRADARPSSGTPFRQLAEACAAAERGFHYACVGVSRFANTEALFKRAQALRVCLLEDVELLQQDWDSTAATLQAFCAPLDALYLSLDLDCLPAAVMPAVSAPAAYGLPLPLVERLLQSIIATGKVQICDVAEFNPRFDVDGRGARTAARLIAVMVEAWAKRF